MENYIQEYKQIFEGKEFLRNGKPITLEKYPAFDGGGVRTLIPKILEELDTRSGGVSVLDWGCGTAIHWHKQTLVEKTKSLMNVLGEKVQTFYRYDPAVALYSKKPLTKFDIVLCSDVLEHIPDTNLPEFFSELYQYVEIKGTVFYSVSTKTSNNSFLTGENMHINIKNASEWIETIKRHGKPGIKVVAVFNGTYYY